MESNNKKQPFELVKKRKVILIIFTIILSIIIFAIPKLYNAYSIKSQLKNYYETECKLKDVSVTLEEAEKFVSFDYYAYIKCSNLSDFSYEEMTSFKTNLNIDKVQVKEYLCNGDTYKILEKTVYKNGDEVYDKEPSTHSYSSSYSSSNSSHSCIVCSSYASRSYISPFSGQTEWYCLSCYNELQDMIDQLRMN